MQTLRSYDGLGRLTNATSAGLGRDSQEVAFTYDQAGNPNNVGRLTRMDDPSGYTDYWYDRRGLPLRVATAFDTTTFQYDGSGNRTAVGYPSGRTMHVMFDFASRPVTASLDGAPIVTQAAYLPFGPATEIVFGNGTIRRTSYDSRYRPLTNTLTGGGGLIASYSYVHEGAGNVTAIHDQLEPVYDRDFGYDDLNRLVAANTGSGLWGNGSYQYDSMVRSLLGSHLRSLLRRLRWTASV